MLLLGNEAIARGAIEAGIGLAAAYPGTPSTEVMETLILAAKDLGFYVEWSVNEKVALEVAFGASITGIRSLVAMKHVGVNVAMDSLVSLGYTGVNGGFLLVSAEDPSMHSSQNEQDNRWIGVLSYIPVFEAYNPHEAKELTRYLFGFSEDLETPVILRTTTRLSHTRGVVEYGEIRDRKVKGKFERNIGRWVLLPRNARVRREIQLGRWEKIMDAVNNVPFNWIEDDGAEDGVIAVGSAYGYVKEAAASIEKSFDILKISSSVPFPMKLVDKFLEAHPRVLVVEELEPVVEMSIKNSFYGSSDVEIRGKDLVGYKGELNLDRVFKALSEFLGLPYKGKEDYQRDIPIPGRPPVLCPGCPHRATFFALRKAVNMSRVNAIYPGDIGCYTLGVQPPYEEVDTTISMGSGIGIANGLAHTQDNMVIATIGDSTFYHAGIPGLINAVYNFSPLLLVVMDNEVTAMTGDQPNPGTGYTALGRGAERIPIEDIARGVGVKRVKVVDPYNVKETLNALKDLISYIKDEGKPGVLVARRECSLVYVRRVRRKGEVIPTYYVDDDKCTGCRICVDQFACPAIFMVGDKAWIDESMCTGCGVCDQICPFKAFHVREI
jgi:indolepyruvate ferredoxin oxidoreductase alpha subunit